MSSWRETSTEQAQQDLDDLLDEMLTLAERFLGAEGMFYPFSGSIDLTGSVSLAMAESESRTPDVGELISTLTAGLIDDRESLRACAVAANVGHPTGSDAVEVRLEHREGVSLQVVAVVDVQDHQVAFGDLTASRAAPRIWAA